MTERSSNRERIARMALEAEQARKERARAADKKPSRAPKAAGRARQSGRTRVVWRVCNQRGDTVQTFPYPEEAAARAEAERLTAESGRAHFVTRGEEPVA